MSCIKTGLNFSIPHTLSQLAEWDHHVKYNQLATAMPKIIEKKSEHSKQRRALEKKLVQKANEAREQKLQLKAKKSELAKKRTAKIEKSQHIKATIKKTITESESLTKQQKKHNLHAVDAYALAATAVNNFLILR
jgi:hypothetical protein